MKGEQDSKFLSGRTLRLAVVLAALGALACGPAGCGFGEDDRSSRASGSGGGPSGDADGDGLPDSWEMAYFQNLTWGAGDDPDGDGATNLQEHQAGTDPTVAPPPGDRAPLVSFTSPVAGATLTGIAAVNARANDPDAGASDGAGIATVALDLLQGTLIVASHTENIVSYDWSLDTTTVPNGSYTLRATATSAAAAGGTSTIAAIAVTITNGGAPPPPPPQTGQIYVTEYVNGQGSGLPSPSGTLFWQSSYTTLDGTLIEWGTGDHGHNSDNGVREYDPVARSQAYVYPNNSGTKDVTQYDNLQYWYMPRIDSLVIPSRGQYHRATGRWTRGENITFFPNGPRVVGTGANDLIRPINGVDVSGFQSGYNGHQEWSAQYDSGVIIAGGNGGDDTARQMMWLVVPSAGMGSYPQPYVVFNRSMPASVGGVAAHWLNGRDGCCFVGEYVYWVGGEKSVVRNPVPYFFRMRITPHLTDGNAPLSIERLPDLPTAKSWCLLRSDPYVNALLCICEAGVFAYDLSAGSWSNVTPQAYRDEFASMPPCHGLLPYGCLGDFVDTRAGQVLRKFYWRPGHNYGWDFDFGGAYDERMHRRFRSIQLARR